MIDSFNDIKCFPFMVEKGGIIQDVSDMFVNLTGFEKNELNNKSISLVWKKFFRINIELNLINTGVEIILFTKALEARFVTISKTEDIKKDEVTYIFIEKINSRLENKMLFIERLISDNKFGVAVYTAKDFLLLKASEAYVNYLPKPFNSKENSYGKPLAQILHACDSEEIEREFKRIIETNKSLYITEMQGLLGGFENKYWNNTITPIIEDGQVKYLVSILQDVTERVLSREHIRIKNEQLEAIVNSVSDIICIVDKHVRYISGNKFSKRIFDSYKENLNLTNKNFKIFGDNEKELDQNKFNSDELLYGKEFERVRVNIEVYGKIKYFILSRKLIYDEKHEIEYGVFVLHNITEEIKLKQSYKQIDNQKKELDTIIQSMSDGLAVIDKSGRIIKANKAIANVSEEAYNKYTINHVDETESYGWKHFDECGREISKEELPIYKILNGEHVKHQRILNIKGNIKKYVEYNCTPIFDNAGNFQYGVILRHDITDMVEKEQKIKNQQELLYKSERKQREILEKALIMKDEFISLISHEFKTPLNVIYSAIQLIEYVHIKKLPERVQELIKSIKQNTFRQLRLVNNLLDITRLNSGRLKLHMKNMDIIFLTKMIIESVRLYVEQKNIRLSFKTNVESKVIAIDDEKYERIILNLLSNAVKFTSEGGNIAVNIKEDKILNKLTISVIDTGIGIPEDKQEVIFERFGQVESSLSRQAEGTGIGLSLVKLLVDAFDGEINVKSQVGNGSTFEVILPLKESMESEEKDLRLDADSRLVNAVNVEFSDIYL